MSATIRVPNTAAAGAAVSIRKNVFKNCAPFTNCISDINNTQIDNTRDINIVMPIYNLIEYSDNYCKTSGGLSHYYRDEPFLNANSAIADVLDDNNSSALFKVNLKQK